MIKKLSFVAVLLVAGMVSGCGPIVTDLVQMTYTSHDAGSCAGFQGQTQAVVEERLNLQPSESFLDGDVAMAYYEKGLFVSTIVYKDGKVSKYYCGSQRAGLNMAKALYKQYAEERVSGKPKYGPSAEQMMQGAARKAENR